MNTSAGTEGFPHWFVVGAQKSGTTAMCSLLAQHAGIQVSTTKEPMFISRDEGWLHPHMFAAAGADDIAAHNWAKHGDTLVQQYLAQYFPAPAAGRLRGEGSTALLCSHRAPERIAQYNPAAKIIAILRNPVDRAYSAYWHMVSSGVATHDFAGYLRFGDGKTLYTGHYEEHLRCWLAHFSRAQCHVVTYEHFKRSPQEVMESIFTFLGLKPQALDLSSIQQNTATVPRHPKLQLLLNYLAQRMGTSIQYGIIGQLTRRNCTATTYPPMDNPMRRKLTLYYQQHNAGLDALLNQPVTQNWW